MVGALCGAMGGCALAALCGGMVDTGGGSGSAWPDMSEEEAGRSS